MKMQTYERNAMSREDMNALFFDDEKDAKMHARVLNRLDVAKKMGLKRREMLHRKCHENLLKALKKYDTEHIDHVVSRTSSRREDEQDSGKWSMKKLSIVRRLLGNRDSAGPETNSPRQISPLDEPPFLSSKAKLAKSLMKIGLSSPNSAGLKEAWSVQKRKDAVARYKRWKNSNNNSGQ